MLVLLTRLFQLFCVVMLFVSWLPIPAAAAAGTSGGTTTPVELVQSVQHVVQEDPGKQAEGSLAAVHYGLHQKQAEPSDPGTPPYEQALRAYQQFNQLLTYEPHWDGNVQRCEPGTVRKQYIGATLEAINLFRRLANMKPVGLSDELNKRAQAAALTMYASGKLDHQIDNTFTCYSDTARIGARHSNLAMQSGPAAILSYIQDPGPTNQGVGHRRWLLRPTTNVMGIGDTGSSNAVWVFGKQTYPTQWTQWPPAGYFPSQWVTTRWSLSADAAHAYDFYFANVTMTDEQGNKVPLTQYRSVDAYGFDTLVWELDDRPVARGKTIRTYTVTVDSIRTKSNTPVEPKTWQVHIFDAEYASPKQLKRLSGPERITTAIAVSQAHFEANTKPFVTLATADAFPDALVGAAAATWRKGPLLLTRKDKLPPEVVEEIERLGSTDFGILGGTGAISEQVVDQLHGLKTGGNNTVMRMAGRNRYETATAIATATFTKPGSAILVGGDSFGDALAAANLFDASSYPIFLANPEVAKPAEDVLRALRTLKITRISVINGGSKVPDSVVKALQREGYQIMMFDGKDAYDATIRTAKYTYADGAKNIYFVTGERYPDGLAAGTLTAGHTGPIILINNGCLPPSTVAFIETMSPHALYAIGGRKMVPDAIGQLKHCS